MVDSHIKDPLENVFPDFDSFLEETKPIEKKLTKSPDERMNSELFDFDQSNVKNTNTNKDWLGIEDIYQPTKSKSNPIKKISFENDDEDVLSDLGLGKFKDEKAEKKSQKISLMEDIFGTGSIKVKKATTFDDIVKNVATGKAAQKTTNLSNRQDNVEQEIKAPNYLLTTEIVQPREGRRSRHQPVTLMDPLGMHNVTENKSISEINIPSSPSKKQGSSIKSPTDPFTLQEKDSGISLSSQDSKTDIISPHTTLESKSAPNLLEHSNWIEDENHVPPLKIRSTPNLQLQMRSSEENKLYNQNEQLNTNRELNSNMDTILNQHKLASSQMELQNVSIALQQQESQVLVALQLKKYEESLSDMQQKQHEVLVKQEQHFNNFLEQQLLKQQTIENNMRMQQERINSHIQMLISQPHMSMGTVSEEKDKITKLKQSKEDETCEIYQETIKSMKERTREEIFLLEDSYK